MSTSSAVLETPTPAYDWSSSDYHSFMEDEVWIFAQYKDIRLEARRWAKSNGRQVRTSLYKVGKLRRFRVNFL
jgi:hypothetical protein